MLLSGRGRRRGVEVAGLSFLAAIYVYRSIVEVVPFLRAQPGDFSHYYRASRAVLEGASPFLDPFANQSPLLVWMTAPVAALDFTAARWVWFAASWLALAAALALLVAALGGDRAALWTAALLWTIGGHLPANLGLGQINPWILLLICGALAARTARPQSAALLVGLAVALKIWPAALFAPLAWRQQRRALAWGIAVAISLLVASDWVLRRMTPPPHRPIRAAYWLGTPAAGNRSLSAAVLRETYRDELQTGALPNDWLAGNNPGELRLSRPRLALSAAVAALVLAAGLTALAAARPQGAVPCLAALTTLAVVASPISWYHYALLHLPALGCLGAQLVRRKRWFATGGWLLLALAPAAEGLGSTLIAPAICTPVTAERLAGWLAPGIGIVLFVWVLATARHRQPAGHSAT
jgi:hypothetical protein